MRHTSVVLLAVVAALGLATEARAQVTALQCIYYPFLCTPTKTPTPQPTPTPTMAPVADAFQIRYATNLNIGDSFVNLSNAGSLAGTDPAGNICANVYVFDQSEEMLECCSCKVSPNGLSSFSVKNQLISNNDTPEIPNSIVIKLLATAANGAACNPASPTFASLAPGLRAWGTTLHALPTTPVTYGLTETEFSRATLSASELAELTLVCGVIQTNDSGFGICKGCSIGGL